MPFDAGFAAALTEELNASLSGAKIEKIGQPEKDEVLLTLKNGGKTHRLLICAKASSARMGLTAIEKENPPAPPMFCMLLRKHLSGGVIAGITQLGFERAIRITVHSYNELGYPADKSLILETTGRYSNIIFCDENDKVVSALRLSEIMSDEKRKLLCGFSYQPLPLPEGRDDPLRVTKEAFLSRFRASCEENGGEYPCDKFLLSSYYGLSPLVCREITYRTALDGTAYLSAVDPEKLFLNFQSIYASLAAGNARPCMICDKTGKVIEFSFCEIRQYGTAGIVSYPASFSELLDTYYGKRDMADRIRQKSQDILKLLTNASTRIAKKAALQKRDLEECAGKDVYKRNGDLITANMYLLKKGMTEAEVVDYSDETMPRVTIRLEINLTPSQNAARYYKKYNKLKSAEENLRVQLEASASEMAYIDTVFESLTKAQNEKDLEEIREELRAGGYGKKLDAVASSNAYLRAQTVKKAKKTYAPMTFRTSGGYPVLCGKNNLQNDYITMTKAEKNDYWFHVKNMPGSHVLMQCGDEEPDAKDFTECAVIAAYYSSGRKIPQVAVDYTRARYIKKPAGARPGFVVYETNYSAYVTADEETVERLRTDK